MIEPNRVAIIAGAGAGKTTRITQRYVYHVMKQGLSPLEIVAVTFTEAAALELKSRVREKLGAQLPRDDDRLAELEAARISTFHSLAAAICRQHSSEAGVPGDFSILDEVQGALWLADKVDDALDALPDSLFRRVGFTQMRTMIRGLLEDPITAEAALSKRYRDWRDEVREAQRKVIEELTSSEAWIQTRSFLLTNSGQPGDKLESARSQMVAAMRDFEAGTDTPDAAARIASINLQGGSQKLWPTATLSEVKDSIKAVRDPVKAFLEDGLLTMTPGAQDAEMLRKVKDLRKAYSAVRDHLFRSKVQERLLDFSDLEVHALRALSHPQVRQYYHDRWLAFLVDEYQDTNRVQEQILTLLRKEPCSQAIVGDPNQSIYGFRRADPRLIINTSREIVATGGERQVLPTNYRTHTELVRLMNSVFGVLFSSGSFSPQSGVRPPPDDVDQSPAASDDDRSWLQVFQIELSDGEKRARAKQSRAEAINVARLLRKMHAEQTLVFDREHKVERALEWRDVAIIARSWASLDVFAEALSSLGIPSVLMGGGNLMTTREAKDGAALLRFLADTRDDLALAAVLKSPFFSLSDLDLYVLTREKVGTLLEALRNDSSFRQACGILDGLIASRDYEAPSRLLHRAALETGIAAILLNLPSGERRLADWRGFVGLVEDIEKTSYDAFSVARVLRRIQISMSDRAGGVQVPRPALESGDAVSLMSIHRSKGLEWPVVVLPDMTKSSPVDSTAIYVDPELGVALKAAGLDKKEQPALFRLLRSRKKQAEKEEDKRLLYVAATRCRDYLFISSTAPGAQVGGLLQHLMPGLNAVSIAPISWPYSDADSLPPVSRATRAPLAEPKICIGPVSAPLTHLPATGFGVYSRCPKQFEYRFVLGHPGVGGGDDTAARIGTLVHIAIQYDIDTPQGLQRYDRTLAPEHVMAAVYKARAYRNDPRFEPFRSVTVEHEVPVAISIGGMSVSGRIDLLGPDFVLDFKTGRRDDGEQHMLQLWLYAESESRERMVICYFDEMEPVIKLRSELPEMRADVEELAANIRAGRFEALPETEKCTACRYNGICEDGMALLSLQPL